MNKIGCHVSVKAPEYIEGAVREALSYKANALMIYTGAPQNTIRKAVDQLRIPQAQALLKENEIPLENVIVHAPYIINLGNVQNPSTFELGVQFLKKELQRTAAIGARYLVLHPGSSVKATPEEGLARIIEGLNLALEDEPGPVMICLETMAGKGSELGSSFEQLRLIRDGVVKKERIAFCLDTCHIHDAGYDLNHFDEVLTLFDQIIGLEHLKVIHLNDSKNVRGARKDRHANLGHGEIGFDALVRVFNHPLLAETVKILETPYVGDHAPYGLEIEMLRSGVYDPHKLDALKAEESE